MDSHSFNLCCSYSTTWVLRYKDRFMIADHVLTCRFGDNGNCSRVGIIMICSWESTLSNFRGKHVPDYKRLVFGWFWNYVCDVGMDIVVHDRVSTSSEEVPGWNGEGMLTKERSRVSATLED